MGKTPSPSGRILLLGALCAAAVALGGAVLAASPEDANQAAPSDTPRFDPGGEEALPPLPTPQAPPPPGPPPRKKKEAAPPPPPAPIPEKRRVGPKRPFGEDLQVLDRIVFEAQVRDQPGRSEPLVLRDLRWTCTLTRCTAEGPRVRFGVEACAELAHAVGPVSSFRGAGRALSKQELLQCNASATPGAGGFGVAPGGGGFGPPRKTASPSPRPLDATLDQIARDFAGRIRALPPPSARDASCPASLESGGVARYFDAAQRGAAGAARAELTRLYRELDCVSAARFFELSTDLLASAIPPELGGDGSQILAPLLLLLADLDPFVTRLLQASWWREHGAELVAAAGQPDSLLSHIGLLVEHEDQLWLLSGQEMDGTLTALHDGSASTCGLAELIDLEVNGKTRLVCPKDCAEGASEIDADEDRSLVGTARRFPEFEKMCDELKQAAGSIPPGTSKAIGTCVQAYADSQGDRFTACLSDRIAAQKRAVLDPLAREQRSLTVQRSCWESDWVVVCRGPNATECSLEYVDPPADPVRAVDPGNPATRTAVYAGVLGVVLYHSSHEARAGADVATKIDSFIGDDPLGPILAVAQMVAGEIAESRDDEGAPDRDTHTSEDADTSDDEARSSGSGDGSCDPTVTTCVSGTTTPNPADGGGIGQCGVQDWLAQATSGCWSASGAGERRGSGREPVEGASPGADPTRAMPDPRSGQPGPAVAQLRECLQQATGGSRPAGQDACGSREDCPDHSEPHRNAFGKCVCGGASDAELAGYCPGYVDPKEGGSGCIPVPGAERPRGGRPEPPPGLGGPMEPAIRIPLGL